MDLSLLAESYDRETAPAGSRLNSREGLAQASPAQFIIEREQDHIYARKQRGTLLVQFTRSLLRWMAIQGKIYILQF